MKHVGKALIIAGTLSFCGIILLGIGSSMLYAEGRNGVRNSDTEYVQKEYTVQAGKITSIKTDIPADNVCIEPGEGNHIEIVYTDKIDNPEYQITENGGTLQIIQKPLTGFHLFSIPDIPFGWEDIEEQLITIKIPEEYSGSYDLHVNSGKVSCRDLKMKDELQINCTSGTIKLDNLTCNKNITIIMSSGSLAIEHLEANENMSCRLTSGNAGINDITVSKDLTIRSSSGNVDITSATVEGIFNTDFTSGEIFARTISVDKVSATLSSGKINLDELTVKKGVNASATSGGIKISLTDSADNYTITSKITSGHCNLPENFGSGDKYIDAQVSSGSIDFSFKK